MRDTPDPGHPYDDFPAEPSRAPFWQSVLGFLYPLGCLVMFFAIAVMGIHGPSYWIGLTYVPPVLALVGPFVAHFALKWKGFLRGYLLGLGLALLVFGTCVAYLSSM